MTLGDTEDVTDALPVTVVEAEGVPGMDGDGVAVLVAHADSEAVPDTVGLTDSEWRALTEDDAEARALRLDDAVGESPWDRVGAMEMDGEEEGWELADTVFEALEQKLGAVVQVALWVALALTLGLKDAPALRLRGGEALAPHVAETVTELVVTVDFEAVPLEVE